MMVVGLNYVSVQIIEHACVLFVELNAHLSEQWQWT